MGLLRWYLNNANCPDIAGEDTTDSVGGFSLATIMQIIKS